MSLKERNPRHHLYIHQSVPNRSGTLVIHLKLTSDVQFQHILSYAIIGFTILGTSMKVKIVRIGYFWFLKNIKSRGDCDAQKPGKELPIDSNYMLTSPNIINFSIFSKRVLLEMIRQKIIKPASSSTIGRRKLCTKENHR